MEKVCPICNALEKIHESCPQCGNEMVDGGALQNYLGPYSPYMEPNLIPLNSLENGCVHLVYCPICHYDTRVSCNFVII